MSDYQIYIFYCSLGNRLSKKNHASSIFCFQVSLTCPLHEVTYGMPQEIPNALKYMYLVI